MKKDKNTVVVECQCYDLAHRVRFSYDEDDTNWLIEMVATAWVPWYKRLWVAIKYIFKFDIIEYAEVIADKEDLETLTKYVTELKKARWNRAADMVINPMLDINKRGGEYKLPDGWLCKEDTQGLPKENK